MKNNSHYSSRKLSALTIIGLLCSLSAFAADYTIIDLGTLGGNYSSALGINSSGQVIGYSDTGAAFGIGHAFLYTGGQMSDLGSLYEINSIARGINSTGQIAGAIYNTTGFGRAFIYNNGVMTDIGTSPSPYNLVTDATAINDAGQIAGYSNNNQGSPHAFLYSNGTITDIGAAFGEARSWATAINSTGQVVGGSSVGAFLYSNGSMSILGNFTPSGINALGQVVGYDGHAVLYDNGTITDLGALNGGSSWAEAINTSGWIVGESTLSGGQTNRAFIYKNGVMTDLNDLISANSGWTLIETARAINDSGQIVGQGTINGITHAYLMTPVPIPATFLLFISGLTGLFGFMRRRYTSIYGI